MSILMAIIGALLVAVPSFCFAFVVAKDYSRSRLPLWVFSLMAIVGASSIVLIPIGLGLILIGLGLIP